MKALVFYAPTINHNEFQKEAKRFARCHKILEKDVIGIKTKQSFQTMRRQIMHELRKRRKQDYDCVAFFCHGWPRKLQLGFQMASVPALAKRIAEMSADSVTVVLYACSTAKDDHTKPDGGCGMGEDGGFAHELRDGFRALGKEKVAVFAHITSGHLSYNPHVVVHGMQLKWYEFADYVIRTHDGYWQKWRKRLRKNKDFRFRFPFMGHAEIIKELTCGKQ